MEVSLRYIIQIALFCIMLPRGSTEPLRQINELNYFNQI